MSLNTTSNNDVSNNDSLNTNSPEQALSNNISSNTLSSNNAISPEDIIRLKNIEKLIRVFINNFIVPRHIDVKHNNV